MSIKAHIISIIIGLSQVRDVFKEDDEVIRKISGDLLEVHQLKYSRIFIINKTKNYN